ncbi:MAG: ACT domain-containing protein [Spirochaetaceae bacterium]|jgi:ACT domain-containing protein|nr:ACT domain-containing protein [Spirochaetaceae bacterium]
MNEKTQDGGAIVTVVGSDQVGIIAQISAFFAEHGINIEDINQTILSGNFVMMMMVNLRQSTLPLEKLKEELAGLGTAMHVSISILHEQVFTAMHRI